MTDADELATQTRYIFGTKKVKPIFKTESSNKAVTQTSRHMVKETQTPGGGESGVVSLMMWHQPANQKQLMGHLHFHLLMDGIWRPSPGKDVESCGQQPWLWGDLASKSRTVIY